MKKFKGIINGVDVKSIDDAIDMITKIANTDSERLDCQFEYYDDFNDDSKEEDETSISYETGEANSSQTQVPEFINSISTDSNDQHTGEKPSTDTSDCKHLELKEVLKPIDVRLDVDTYINPNNPNAFTYKSNANWEKLLNMRLSNIRDCVYAEYIDHVDQFANDVYVHYAFSNNISIPANFYHEQCVAYRKAIVNDIKFEIERFTTLHDTVYGYWEETVKDTIGGHKDGFSQNIDDFTLLSYQLIVIDNIIEHYNKMREVFEQINK